MQPTVDPPPWRVIESPGPATAEPTAAANGHGQATTGGSPKGAGLVIDPRVLATVVATIACAAIAFVLAFGSAPGTTTVDGGTLIGAAASGGAGASPPLSGEVVVEIVGAVARPGVYRLAAGTRLVDLLEATGGYGPRVDTARAEVELNLASTLHDGDQVRVPSRDDVAASTTLTSGSGGSGGSAGAGSAGGGGAPVSLNTATTAELEALPGIGPATAAKIIVAREEAPFVSVDELRSRGVLGEKTFEKLRDLVRP